MEDRRVLRNLPDGSLTRDADAYTKAWHEIGDKVSAAIGMRLVFYNPGFTFLGPNGTEPWLPVDLAKWIADAADAKRVLGDLVDRAQYDGCVGVWRMESASDGLIHEARTVLGRTDG